MNTECNIENQAREELQSSEKFNFGVIDGVILRMVLKSGKGRDFANGVLIGGAASALSGLVGSFTSGLGGGLFSERKTSAPSRISRDTNNMVGVKF